MTAAEKKIILEQGSDYRIQLRVKADDGINDKDLDGWTWTFKIYNKDGTVYPIAGDPLTDVPFDGTFAGDDLLNGQGTVNIDSLITAAIDTGITGNVNPFDTEFNYYYTLTIKGTESPANSEPSREMRIMRGRLAVRI